MSEEKDFDAKEQFRAVFRHLARVSFEVGQLQTSFESRVSGLEKGLEKGQQATMATLLDVQAAIAKQHTDLATLVGLIPQLIAKVASGGLSSTDAQALLDQINPDDTSIGSMISAIQSALGSDSTTTGSNGTTTTQPSGDSSAQ